MPVQYIGRVTYFKGKRLFDILSRLKNFGIGRIVYRHVFHERYEEPSYYIITKVAPDMSDPGEHVVDQEADKLTRGVATAIKVFRGENKGITSIRAGFKADWRLVPKDKEHLFLECTAKPRESNVVPSRLELPPLFEQLYLDEKRRQGVELKEKPMLDIQIRTGPDNRAVTDGELEKMEANLC